MSDTQAKLASPGRRVGRFFIKLATILAVAVVIGFLLNHVAASLARSGRPAGFSRGLVQGALMPMALPNLLIGHDVTIYAALNTGRLYKLGYTMGVNACGSVFFGLFFWRVHRWRKSGMGDVES
jgi:hypothetical protein